MRTNIKVGLVMAIAVSLMAQEAAAEWVTLGPATACHTYLAYPWAANCDDFDWVSGYRIQEWVAGPDVWRNDSAAGARAMAIAFGGTWVTAHAITLDGRVLRRTGGASPVWQPMPLNKCGTNLPPIQFNHGGERPILAVMDDVPWVIDASGRVRFWRTAGSPDCWAAVATVPGSEAMRGIGAYRSSPAGIDRIWALRGINLYLFDGAQWQLIDTETAEIGNGHPFVLGKNRQDLWQYHIETGEWSLEAVLPVKAKRLDMGGIYAFFPQFIDDQGRVWDYSIF